MATQLEHDEPLELDESQALEEPDAPEQTDEVEDVPTFGDEPETPEQPTDLVKHLRQQIRERDKQLSQVRKAPPAEQPIEVGARPTIEACDFDQERFDTEFDAWEARREAKRQQDQNAEQQQRQQHQAWEQVQNNYATKKAALRFADKDQVEATAFEALSPTQQAVIAKVAPDPALLIYAVGKNPAKLDQLAAIDDPLVLAATIGRMGATLQMKKRSAAPEPEQVVRGGTVRQQSSDKVAEKLLKEGQAKGDMSAYSAYMRDQRKAARKA